MKKNNQRSSLFQPDFRKRFAQRDLEISRNEYEYLKDEYLESESARKKAVSDKVDSDNENPLTTQKVEVPRFLNYMSEYNPDLYKKPESKKKGAPEEKLEHHLDITLPTIQSLVDDYTKPYVYNPSAGKFEQLKDSWDLIGSARENIQNRPTPLGITNYEEMYMRATDPASILAQTREKYQIDKQYTVDKALDAVSDFMAAPANLLGTWAANKVKSSINGIFDKNREYIDDIISTWAVGKNNAEVDAYVDSGIRLGEKQQYANAIQRYSDNIQKYVDLQSAYDKSTSPGERHNLLLQMNNLLAENSKLRPAVEEAVTYTYDSDVLKTAARNITEFVNNGLNNSLVNTIAPPTALLRAGTEYAQRKMFGKDDVGANGKKLLELIDANELKPGESLSPDFLESYRGLTGRISAYNEHFQKAAQERILKDKEMALQNKQEALEWEAWHTPSREFKAKEKAAQDNYLLSADTYKYGMWGVLGSSASFNGVQMLSTGLDWLGMGLLMAPNPYAKVGGAAATAVGGGLGLLSGVYENRAEVTQNYIQGLQNSLQKEGLLKKFLDEGRKQLKAKGIEVRDDQDVFRHFILKDYKTNNPVIQELALRHMFGANNVFQNDMMAVSADVAINAGINLFGATGKVAEALKIIPEGSGFSLLRKVAQSPTASKMYHGLSGVSGNAVVSAISPLANIPYNIVKPVFKGAKSALTPMVKEAARYMDKALSWSKVAPKAIFNTGTVGKYVFDFLGKTATRGYSESIEEGKQYEYGRLFSEGKLAGESKSIFGTLMDDLSTGLYTGMLFIGHQFFGLQSDRELMANMRGGFLGGIMNHGTMITAVQNFTNTAGELNAGSIIFNNLMAEKIRQRADLVNGEEMGKYASRVGYVAMMNAFDRIQSIHDRITNDATERVGLTQEELSDQRALFRRISALSNDKKVIDRAKELGIKQGTYRFRKFVSLTNLADKIQSENISEYNDLVHQAEELLAQDGLSLSVSDILNRARQMASTPEQQLAVDVAELFAKWIQPLNNQVMGQYAALNKLIEELEVREEFLTPAERRSLAHYRAQRQKLDQTVAQLRQDIGGVENMEFLNYGDPEILTKYSQIYRTLFQASAQLEMSSLVLDSMYGENNAKDIANEFVAEQLDFINERIKGASEDKKKAVKASKKSARNKRAKEFLEQYEKSVNDDINLMAELADRFDNDSYDANNRLNFASNAQTEDAVREESIAQEGEAQGAQNMPVSMYDKAPQEAKQFPVGTKITNTSEPNSEFEVTGVKVNPTTGRYLLEVKDKNDDVRYVEPELINQYQALLPAPYHYENVFNNPTEWLRLKNDSPLVKAIEASKTNTLPSVKEHELQDHLQLEFGKPLPWDPYEEDPQANMIDYVGVMNANNRLAAWHPVYGSILEIGGEEARYIYIPTVRDIVPQLYPEFDSERRKRKNAVAMISQLRDLGKMDEIRTVLEQNGIDPLYMEVLNQPEAVNAIARAIATNTPRMREWLSALAYCTDSNNRDSIGYVLPLNERMPFFNVTLANQVADVTADILTVDESGGVRIYILAFPKNIDDVDNTIGYYNALADAMYSLADIGIQQHIRGFYVLPIERTDSGYRAQSARQLTLSVVSLPVLDQIVMYRNAIESYYNTVRNEVNDFMRSTNIPGKTRPEAEADGTQELRIANIESSVSELEGVIANVYNGTFSFNGRIRSDARQYLENMRTVLNKHRNALRDTEATDQQKNLLERIQQAYDKIVHILSSYPASSVYLDTDILQDGDFVKSHMAIIPVGHPLSARSTSGIPVTASSDFITNGKVELSYGWYNQQTGEFTPMAEYSTHPGVGVYATFTYNGIKYPPVLVLPSHYKNGIQMFTQEGVQFTMDVINAQRDAQGLPIVGEALRMIPTPVYKGQPKPLVQILALGLTEDDIQAITPTSDNIGITGVDNTVKHIDKTDDKSTLWTFSNTQAGSIFYFHSFKFDEFQDGGVTPVKLIPAKLKTSDINVIVNILKQNALNILTNGRAIMLMPYMLADGREAPLTNAQVLYLYLPYDMSPNNESVFWTDSFGNVYFKQRKSDRQPEGINIITQEGESIFRNLISNGYELAHMKDVLNGNMGNPNDRVFGKLHLWVLLNGMLNISESAIFNTEDVSKNGTGYYGIGWAIKHGRLQSNLSSIYEPSIQISSPVISDNPANPPIDGPASTGEPKVHNKPKARFIPEDGEGLLNDASEEIPENPVDEEEAREDIRRMLGDAAVEFVDEILGVLSNGLKALAATMDNIIIISKLAAQGVLFHESFHRILELLFDDKTRARVYSAFWRLHPELDSTNARSITEAIAEEFRAYAKEQKVNSTLKKYFYRIKRFVLAMLNADRRFLYKVYRNAYKGKYRNLKPSKENIERFNRIFASTIEGDGVLYHTIYNPSTGKHINLPNVPSAQDYRTAINTIVDNVISYNGQSIFGSSIQSVVFDKQYILQLGKNGSVYKALVGEGQEPDDINKIFIDIFEHWDDVLDDVALSLKRFGLHFRHTTGNTVETYKTNLSDEELNAVDEADEGKSKTADINQYELQDYEISKINKMSEVTKFFFATIPDIRFVEEDDEEPMYVPERNSNGERIDTMGRVINVDPETKMEFVETEDGQFITGNNIKYNLVRNITYNLNEFGFRQFAPFFMTCHIALNRCYSANSLHELLNLFRKVAIEHPLFTVIANRFAQLIDRIKKRDKNGYYLSEDGRRFRRMDNGLFQQVIGKDKFGEEWYTADEIEFVTDDDVQSTAVSIFNNISGTRLHFRHTMSTRPSKDAIIFQTIDTDNGYSARRYEQSWHSTFLGDVNKVDSREEVRNGDVVMVYRAKNINLFRTAAANIKTIVDAYTDRRSQGYSTGRIIIDGKQIAVNRDPEAVKTAYLKQLNSIGITVTKDQFNHLLFMEYGKTDANALRRYFAQDGEDFGVSVGVSIKRFVLAIEQGVQENGEFSRPVVSGSFFTRIGAVTQLADAIHSYNRELSERMEIAPGKNKYYAIANRNAQDLMIQEMNTPDGQMINDLLRSAYHAGSMYLPMLKNGLIVLSSFTDSGYESDNKSDYGSDFMQMTNSEDVINKMTMLLDGCIVPPTISNKKTYQPILVRDAKTQEVIYLPGIQYVANKNNVQTNDAQTEVYKANNIPVLVDKTFNGEFITPGGKLSKQKLDKNPRQFIVGDDVYDTLIKYAFSEYESILQNIERQKTLPENEKIVNYDTAEKGADKPGGLRFARFYELYVPRKEEDGSITYDTINLNSNSSSVSVEDNLRAAREAFFDPTVSREQRIAIINEILERTFDDNLDYFRKVGIIRYRTGWRNLPKYARYEPVAIDTAHLNAIITAYGNSLAVEGPMSARSIATCALLFDVCLKHQIAMEEYQRMFAGHPGLYVTLFNGDYVSNDTGDLSKRLGGHSSTGETQCELDDVPNSYNCAELRDYKTASSQKDEVIEWFDESESRFTLYATEQKRLSIYIQKLREDLNNIAQEIRRQYLNKEDIYQKYKKTFDGLEEDIKDSFLTTLKDISNAKKSKEVTNHLQMLEAKIKVHKQNLVKSEYGRQKVLSLEAVKQELSDKKLLSGVLTRVAAYASKFKGGINVADGASYVSPIMVKWMLKKIGKFNGRVAHAWNRLQSDNVLDPLEKAEDYKDIMEALFGTQKYTATGYRMNNGLPIFYYNKTALFPLFRQIAYGRTKDILDQMIKDNVHMLMFESAVKFGSQGKQHFPTTLEGLANFRFNVYSQLFKWLRKQLNTDPKESELMSVGSQTKKVALTILDVYKDDYIKRDGTVEDGLTLRNRIFAAERALADIGYRELMSRFSSEDEMVKYLRENLSERDADSDTLQGLSMIENEETGEKEMASPLEGLSNSEWIQSIITSLANKHIVDVNLPGSAFIQRSVFSMEGDNIRGDNEIPSIGKLKISNDWSSMDAVISIDYFYQQFPFLENMSFIEARQWLIDHNIIGEGAEADTVCYRIPTQANSSIHALRFVDVISTVRDTIILPEEFTAITGSDFDIDKLFLSTKYFSVGEDGNVNKMFDKTSDPKKYWGNVLLDCYLELLTQPKSKYANQLIRSIDYDTEIPGKVVKLLEQGSIQHIKTYDALLFYRQCQIKAENRTGGIGVGPYALNNNSEVIGRLFEVEYDNKGIVKALDTSRLYDQIDAEGDSVMATIGAFISGHVDIAKGAWVTVLNINEYTYDIHLYLARAGMGLRALWFCSQPIIRKVADIYILAGGYLFDTHNESAWIRRKKAFNAFEKDVFVDGNSWYQRMIKLAQEYNGLVDLNKKSEKTKLMIQQMDNAMYVIQQIFGLDPNDPSKKVDTFMDHNGIVKNGTILQDIALYHNREEDIYDPTKRYTINMPFSQDDGSTVIRPTQMSTKDIQFFVYLANTMIDAPVQDMKKLVQLSKIETKKQGKNRAEQLAYDARYRIFFGGKTNMMLPSTLRDVDFGTAIHDKQSLFMRATTEMLGKQLLHYTKAYEQFIIQFLLSCGLSNDASSIKAMLNGIASWQKYQFIKSYAKLHDINMRDLFVGNNSIYNTLGRLKNLILDYPAVYSKYTDGNGRFTNQLIDRLQPSDIPGYVLREYGRYLPKFVDFQMNQDDSSASTTDIKAGWEQMLNDSEHPEIQDFARRLVVYAFMTSGDTNVFGGFFKKVPFSWRNDSSMTDKDGTYIDYIKQLLEQSTDDDYRNIDGEFMIDPNALKPNIDIFYEILKNNWGDDSLVPTIQETSKDELGRTVNNYYEYVQEGQPIMVALIKTRVDENGIVHFSESSSSGHKAVIKIHKHDHDSYRNPQDFRLYLFVTMGSVINENNEIVNFPIYGRTAPTGGVMYGHTIIQYGDDLDFGWEGETMRFTDQLRDKFFEGAAQLYDWFDKNLDRNKQAVAEGRVTMQELREDTLRGLVDAPINGSFEDGTPVQMTASNSAKFYNMAKMIGQYLMLNPPESIDPYHNDSLQSIKRKSEQSEQPLEETPKESIDVYSTNRDRYSNLSNVAVRSIELTPSIHQAITNEVGVNIANEVLKQIDSHERFNSVEQLFLIVKFEYMKHFVKLRAYEMFGLDGIGISKGKTPEARAIRGILTDISSKESRILQANGAKITSISHEAIPDINGIVNTEFWEKWNPGGPDNYSEWPAYKVLREIMLQSFLQNPGAARLLMSTVGHDITHNKGSKFWRESFPAALMSVRDEISKTYEELSEFLNKALTILGGDKIAYEEYTLAIKGAMEGMSYDDVTPFFTEEEASQIKSAIPAGAHLRVYSASRHTDPVFYATEIINRLRENFNKPLTDPSRINVMEIWSKHDGIPIQNILEACKKYRVAPMVSFSITGLGNSSIEPGVMKADDLLDNIQKLIDTGILDPRTTTFRVDPILPGVSSIEMLRHIIERGANMGIRKFVTSPMLTYSVQKNRDGSSRSVIPHINAALQNDPSATVRYPEAIMADGTYNWMKYYGLHYDQLRHPGAIAFVPKKDSMKPYIDLMNEMMAKYPITIQSCAVAMGNLQPSACLDPAIIEAVTTIKTDAVVDDSRPFCKCYGVHSDLFRQTDACNSSCVYCYQGWAKASPFDYYDQNGKLKDFSYSKVNDYQNELLGDVGEEPVSVMIKDTEYKYDPSTHAVADYNGNPVDNATRQRVLWKLAMDMDRAHYVLHNGIYYVVTNTGLVFNWNSAKVENLSSTDELKKILLKGTQGSYEKPHVSTLFNAAELKQLGESRMKFCKHK